MEELTGLNELEFLALLVLAVALFLLLQAATRATEGVRIRGILVVPTIGAFVLLLLLATIHRPLIVDLPPKVLSGPGAIAITVGALIVALGLVDLLFVRAVPAVVRMLTVLQIPRPLHADLAMALLLAISLPAFTLLSLRLSPTHASDLRTAHNVQAVASFELPGDPMDIVLDGPTSGYVSLIHGDAGEGRIVRFELPPARDSRLRLQVVAEGLEHPRGIAISGSELFVAEIGAMPCNPSFPQCLGRTLRPTSPIEGDEEILAATRGRVMAYPIQRDGTLASPRVVLSDLPVATSEHALNGMTAGPDGSLFLPIGHVDLLWRSPDRLRTLTPNHEWMGTVLRLNPAGGQPEIFARGLRNVYQVVFDEAGNMWGIDNDGPTLGGWRGEEILQIKQGHHYGYPQEGTFGSGSVRNDKPVWLIDLDGSAGLAWAGDVGLDAGLLVGSCGSLIHLILTDVAADDSDPAADNNRRVDAAHRYAWGDQTPVVTLAGLPGCVTAIEKTGDTEVLASVFTYGGNGMLYRIHFR